MWNITTSIATSTLTLNSLQVQIYKQNTIESTKPQIRPKQRHINGNFDKLPAKLQRFQFQPTPRLLSKDDEHDEEHEVDEAAEEFEDGPKCPLLILNPEEQCNKEADDAIYI